MRYLIFRHRLNVENDFENVLGISPCCPVTEATFWIWVGEAIVVLPLLLVIFGQLGDY
jgi:hypothetical protein